LIQLQFLIATTLIMTTNDDNITQKYHTLFVVGACFNWTAALSFVKPKLICNTLNITPVPTEDFILHIMCLLVALLGSMYYEASKDFPANANIVRYGSVAKALVFSVAVLDVVLGYLSWQILLVVSCDLMFAILYYKALQDLNATTMKPKNK
jgi:hypothetical protein